MPQSDRKSLLSIASVFIFLGVVAFSLISGAIAFIVAVVYNQGNTDEGAPARALLGIAVLTAPFAHLIGIGLGIAGVVKKEPGQLFGVIGIVLNSLFIVVAIGFIILSLLSARF